METEYREGALTIKTFAEVYGLGRTTIYELIKRGDLKVRKVGRRTLIGRRDADDWFNSTRRAA